MNKLIIGAFVSFFVSVVSGIMVGVILDTKFDFTKTSEQSCSGLGVGVCYIWHEELCRIGYVDSEGICISEPSFLAPAMAVVSLGSVLCSFILFLLGFYRWAAK